MKNYKKGGCFGVKINAFVSSKIVGLIYENQNS